MSESLAQQLKDTVPEEQLHRLRNMISPPDGVKATTRNGLLEPINRHEVHIPRLYGAVELMKMDLPETRWIIPGILPQGVTVFFGKEKGFKSYFVLGLCLAISRGQPYLDFEPAEQCDTLYIDLESSARRPRDRIMQMGKTLLPSDHCLILPGTDLVDDNGKLYRIGTGFDEILDEILDSNPEIGLVVIDTYAKIRSTRPGNVTEYDHNIQNIAQLNVIAEKYGVAILLVHHTIRGVNLYDDEFDRSRGVGINETADALWTIARDDKSLFSGRLMIRGRDIESQEYAIRFDDSTFVWQRVPDPGTAALEQLRSDYEKSNIRQTLEAVTQFALKWSGTLSDLISASKKNLTPIVDEPKQLGIDLQKNEAFLRDDGFIFSKEHTRGGSRYTFTRIKND